MDDSALWTYRLRAYRVVDGDTIDATLDLGFHTLRQEKLRLARINAPEMSTPEGKKAKAHLSSLLEDKVLLVKTIKDHEDKYGRYVAEITADGEPVNDLMVSSCHAEYHTY